MELNFYDEYLAFSLDWDNIQANDIKLKRQPDGTFEDLNTSDFNLEGNFHFCWKPPYINYEKYVKASESFWKVLDVPQIYTGLSSFAFNQKIEMIILQKQTSEKSQFSLFKDSPDCDLSNKLNNFRLSADLKTLTIWFPEVRYELK